MRNKFCAMNSNNKSNGSLSSRDSQKSKGSHDSGVVLDLDPDYVPVKIHVYKNGDPFDLGTEMPVTRREFKHWFSFLDEVSKRIKSIKTIQKLCTIKGVEVEGFDELKNNGKYVACAEAFKKIEYGKAKPLSWRPVSRQMNYKDPYGIDSHESLEIHLKKLGFESETGAAFPEDNPANHRTKTQNGRLGVPPPAPRRSSVVVAKTEEKKHGEKEKSTLSLPKISTSKNMTTEQYENENGNSRADSDPERSHRSRRHRSESQRRASYHKADESRKSDKYDDYYYDDEYDRRRRNRSYNRESTKRADDKDYYYDDGYYRDRDYDDYYYSDKYRSSRRYNDDYYYDDYKRKDTKQKSSKDNYYDEGKYM